MSINTETSGLMNPKVRTPESLPQYLQSQARPDRADLANRLGRQQASIASESGTTEAGAAQPRTLTLQGLLKAWGLSGTNYDFNGDGTVNVQDLLKMLSNGGEMPYPNEQPEGSPSPPNEPTNPANPDVSTDSANDSTDQSPTVITLESMMKAYGSDNAAHDLSGDGTVGVQDLLRLLDQGGEMRITPGQQDGGGSSADGDPGEQTFTVTTQGVLKAYHSSNEIFDLNTDGTVNLQDLLRVLNNGGEMRVTVPPDANTDDADNANASEPGVLAVSPDKLIERVQAGAGRLNANTNGPARASDVLSLLAEDGRVPVRPEAPVSIAAADTGPADSSSREQQINQLSSALIDGFEQTGFTSSPPANLPDLLSQFDLTQQDRTSLLSQIRQRYPQGLGLNLVG